MATSTEISTKINSIIQSEDTSDLTSLSDEILLSLNIGLEKKTAALQKENDLFLSFLKHFNPHLLKDYESKLAAIINKIDTDEASMRKEDRSKKKKMDKRETDKPNLLSTDQKAEVANKELEELKTKADADQVEWEKLVDNLRAEMEEAEVRITEIRKSLYEFRRDIVQQARSSRTDKIIAEKIVRYFEDRIKSKDANIEKIRLKNSTLKVQKNKLQLQLKQKEEMGEVLHAIDFEQLKIENHQYLGKIEERNTELLKLKLTAGNTVQTLNFYKKKLSNLSQESDKVKTDISIRKDLLEKLKAETQNVEVDKGLAKLQNLSLRQQMEEYRVPPVLEYVTIKAQQLESAKKVHSWERKVEIAEMALERQRKLYRQIESENKAKAVGWQPLNVAVSL